MDNEASHILKSTLKDNGIQVELVPPYQHQRNAA